MAKIGYARVSTKDQNLDLQLEALKEVGCEKIFSEKKSGLRERPQLEAALAYLRPGDTFVVYKFDRIGRSLKDLLNIVSSIHERGIQIQSLKDNIDTSSTSGKLMMNIFASLAEFERDLINERVREGIEAAKKNGVQFGRKAILNSKEKNVIYKEHEKGKSVAWLSKFFHVARNTIYRAIKDVSKKK